MHALLFRTDATPATGLGHFIRVCVLAESYQGKKDLILRTDDLNLIEDSKKKFDNVFVLPIDAKVQDEIAFYSKLPIHPDTIILDVSNSLSYKMGDEFQFLLEKYSNNAKLAVIDGIKSDSLKFHCPNLICNFLITPYVGAVKSIGKYLHLCGESFYILGKNFKINYEVKYLAKHVLVTMGGSDPTDMTLSVLSELVNLPNDIQVRVVLGPLYSAIQEEELDSFLVNRLNFTKVRNPKHIELEYCWADVVISASGLAKYELAAIGVPMMLLSRNTEMRDINDAFVQTTGCLELGQIEDLTSISLVEEVQNLLLNYELRKKMSASSKLVIDGNGRERILECLLKS